MILSYNFEIMCSVQYDAAMHINMQWFEPHFKRELCDVEFDYYIEPSRDDIEEYYGKGVFSDSFDLDDIEEDEDFIEYMTEKYYDKALEKCEEENED